MILLQRQKQVQEVSVPDQEHMRDVPREYQLHSHTPLELISDRSSSNYAQSYLPQIHAVQPFLQTMPL